MSDNPLIDGNRIILPALPEGTLINNLVDRGGFPRRIAFGLVCDSPQTRMEATIFYFDCMEADAGDSDAKLRLDNVREKTERMKRAERALGNDPDVGAVDPVGRIGMPERVSRTVAAPLRREGKVPSKRELRKIAEKGSKRPLPASLILPPGVRGYG